MTGKNIKCSKETLTTWERSCLVHCGYQTSVRQRLSNQAADDNHMDSFWKNVYALARLQHSDLIG